MADELAGELAWRPGKDDGGGSCCSGVSRGKRRDAMPLRHGREGGGRQTCLWCGGAASNLPSQDWM